MSFFERVSIVSQRTLSFFRGVNLLRNRVFYFFLLYALIFSLLHFFSKGHGQSHIELMVETPVPVFAKMKVTTPRGELDELVFLLNEEPLPPGEHRIEIRNAGVLNPRALDSRITIYQFYTDDIELPLGVFRAEDEAYAEHGFLHLAPGKSVSYQGSFETGKIVFAYPHYSGVAYVYLDDWHYATMDLYSHQGGYHFALPIAGHQVAPFDVRLDLPVSAIDSVRIELINAPGDFMVHSARLAFDDHSYDLNPVLDRQTGLITFLDEFSGLNVRNNSYLLLARLVTSAILALLLIELYLLMAVKKVFATPPYRSFWLLFLISLAVISTGSLGAWPAIMQTDSANIWGQVKYFNFFSWFSHTYSFFVLCLTLLYDSPAILTVVQTLLLSVLLSVFYFYLLRKGLGRAAVCLFFLLTLTSMQVLFYPAFFVRDVIYAIVTVSVFVALFILLLEKRTGTAVRLNAWQLSYLGAALAFAAAIRSEGIYLIVAVPLIYLLLLNLRQGVALFLCAAIMFGALGTPLGSQLDVKEETDYTLTLLMEPLGEIISQPHWSPDREREVATIDRIIGYDDLARHYRDLEAFWNDSFLKRDEYTEEDIENLKKLTIELSILNPHIYLQNRARLFSNAIFAFSGDVEVLPDFQFVPRTWEFVERDKYLLAIYDSAPGSPALIRFQKWMYELSRKSLERNDEQNGAFLLSPRTYFWNAAFGLLFTLIIAGHWYFFRVTALVSALILIRMLILFLFQPMAHFKYYFDICLWGYMVVPMALLEFRCRALCQTSRSPDFIKSGNSLGRRFRAWPRRFKARRPAPRPVRA